MAETAYVSGPYSTYLNARVYSGAKARNGTVVELCGGTLLVRWDAGHATRYSRQELRDRALTLVAADPAYANL